MFTYIIQNWLILLPIVALSVLAIYFILERGFFYYKVREKDKNFESRILQKLREGDFETAISILNSRRTPVAYVLREGIKCRYLNTPEMEKHMEARSIHQMVELEKNVAYLAGIANIATLLGLLGTVSGMIMAFTNMNFFGISDPSVLAGGISQALVTTAAGLGVAIPALLFYQVYTQYIHRTASRLEIAVNDLITLFAESSI